MLKLFLSFLLLASICFPQCGQLVVNPQTGQLDCAGVVSSGSVTTGHLAAFGAGPNQIVDGGTGAVALAAPFTANFSGGDSSASIANTLTQIWGYSCVDSTGAQVFGSFPTSANPSVINFSPPPANSGTCTVYGTVNTTVGGGPWQRVGTVISSVVAGDTIAISGFLQGSSSAPAVNAASCTGATIGAGSTNLAGVITGLPAGACTIVLTFSSATAAHDWSCSLSNRVTPANLFVQSNTGASTTTATFSGVSSSGDAIRYFCGAF